MDFRANYTCVSFESIVEIECNDSQYQFEEEETKMVPCVDVETLNGPEDPVQDSEEEQREGKV